MKPCGYVAALREWLRAYNLRKLQAEAQYYAVAYQAARARLMSAQVRERGEVE